MKQMLYIREDSTANYSRANYVFSDILFRYRGLLPQMWRYSPTVKIIDVAERSDAFLECVEILLLLGHPLYFRKGSHTRQYHVFDILGTADVFCPNVGLNTYDMLGCFRRKSVGNRVHGINLCNVKEVTDGNRLINLILRLVKVEIAMVHRCHDDVVSKLGSFSAGLAAPP